MTREEAKELIPIMQAYVEGKTIQVLTEEGWIDVKNPDLDNARCYRVKPREDVLNRMLKEYEELCRRIDKLDELMSKGAAYVFAKVGAKQGGLLLVQQTLMHSYADVLRQRIQDMKEQEEAAASHD